MTHTIPSRFAHASRAVVRACAAVAVLVATSVGGANAAEVLFRSNPASLPDTVTSFHGSVPPAPPLTQPTQPPGTPDVPVTPAELARAADSLAGLRKASRGVDYLWVLRDQLIEPAAIDSLVDRASRMGVRGLLVQVVGRGDAYYRSQLLPRAEPLGKSSDDDPLAHVLARAHAAGLEVHAWVNCMLVWSGARRPRDPDHVVNAHPEWLAELPGGLAISRLSPKAMQRLNVEGIYLAPAHPGVRRWVASVAAEIASHYDVDGIHLDYIRQPDLETGYDPNTRARFALAQGVDPERMDELPAPQRSEVLATWRQFQRDQVTAVVQAVRDTLRAVRPAVVLSAAVVADTSRSEGSTAQSWRSWVRERRVDRVFLMCYSPDVQHVMDQLLVFDGELGASERVVPGIAVYNTSPSTAALKLRGARAMGYPLLAVYSYDSLFNMDRGWTRLEASLADSPGDEGP